MDAPNDRLLVDALRRGDSSAFGKVLALHGPRIFNFLSRMVGRRDVAEDLYQEAWVKLAVHAPRLSDDTDLAAWLYTVARNLARSERRASRGARGVRTDPMLDERAASTPSPLDWATANETQAALERALSALAEPFREVLLLVVVEGLDHDRAAKILDLSPEALRQRLARARAKLAEGHAKLTKAPRLPMPDGQD